MSRPSTRC
ncbi:hypothetical protein D049_0515A, partial [Vibrio parahaemolyticus VPTS-2010]